MKVVGVDLAGNPKNDTGFCVLTVTPNENSSDPALSEKKEIITRILHSDEDILKRISDENPDLIVIDAPLIYTGKPRLCDDILSEYGALPVTLRGMEVLAVRGRCLAKKLKDAGFSNRLIEVYAKASAKILGYFSKDEKKMQAELVKAGLCGSLDDRFLVKDELDSVFCALTGYLHLKGASKKVGDEKEGEIVIPKV